MSSSWGVAAVDLAFIREQVIPYVFRSGDDDLPALRKGLDLETTGRRLAVVEALEQNRPSDVTNGEYGPRWRAWLDAATYGGEMGRPFLLLGSGPAGERIDRYLASDATTCLDVLATEFASGFPDWSREIGHPTTWPASPWYYGPAYPHNVTAGLDHLRDLWLALQRGETTFVLPFNQGVEEGEQPQEDDIAEYLDNRAFGVLIGYAVARSPTIWSGGGWVNMVAMFDHVQMPTTQFMSARDVLGPRLPTGLLKPSTEAYYNNGRLTDDTAGVVGAVVLPENVAAVRRQFVELGRLLKDPQASVAAAERHLGFRQGLSSLIGSLFGKESSATVSRDEAVQWAEGFAAESEYTLALFEEAFGYAESRGLAIVETSAASIDWPLGVPR